MDAGSYRVETYRIAIRVVADDKVTLFAACCSGANVSAQFDAADLLKIVVNTTAAAYRSNIFSVDTYLLHIHSAIDAQLGTG